VFRLTAGAANGFTRSEAIYFNPERHMKMGLKILGWSAGEPTFKPRKNRAADEPAAGAAVNDSLLARTAVHEVER
jgi:hypothetical protein